MYYNKDLIYDDDVNYYEKDNKVVLDVKKLGCKLFFYKKSWYDVDFDVESTDENWNLEKFVKFSDKVDYTKDEMKRIITSSKALRRMAPNTINKELIKDGYSNVILEPKYDIILGILATVGETESISINEETQFDSYLDYSKDSKIIIYYHEDISKEPSSENEQETNDSEEEKINIVNNQNTLKKDEKEDDRNAEENKGMNIEENNDRNVEKDELVTTIAYTRKINKETDSYLIFDFTNNICYESENTDTTVMNGRFYGDLFNGIDIVYYDQYENEEYHIVCIVKNGDLDKLYWYDEYGSNEFTHCSVDIANKNINKQNRIDVFAIKEYSEQDKANSVNIINDRISGKDYKKNDIHTLEESKALIYFYMYGQKLYPNGFKKADFDEKEYIEKISNDGEYYVRVKVELKDDFDITKQCVAEAKLNVQKGKVIDYKILEKNDSSNEEIEKTENTLNKGWVNNNGSWYFYDDDGNLEKSKWIDNKYYVDSNGKMLSNCKQTINEIEYIFDENGNYTITKESEYKILMNSKKHKRWKSRDCTMGYVQLKKMISNSVNGFKEIGHDDYDIANDEDKKELNDIIKKIGGSCICEVGDLFQVIYFEYNSNGNKHKGMAFALQSYKNKECYLLGLRDGD